VDELHILSYDIVSLSRLHASIQWPKSRINWLKGTDVNYKFFHMAMSSQKRSNAIISIDVNDSRVEGVDGVRSDVFQHFHNHFKLVASMRPDLRDLVLKFISEEDGVALTKLFHVT